MVFLSSFLLKQILLRKPQAHPCQQKKLLIRRPSVLSLGLLISGTRFLISFRVVYSSSLNNKTSPKVKKITFWGYFLYFSPCGGFFCWIVCRGKNLPVRRQEPLMWFAARTRRGASEVLSGKRKMRSAPARAQSCHPSQPCDGSALFKNRQKWRFFLFKSNI